MVPFAVEICAAWYPGAPITVVAPAVDPELVVVVHIGRRSRTGLEIASGCRRSNAEQHLEILVWFARFEPAA